MPRLYLAGPDVFAADAAAIGALKRQICARHGLTGVFPGDLVALDARLDPLAQALAIYDVLELAMRDCDGAFVDLTPFRGPSMDVGTAYEMGFFKALGRPVFAYSSAGPPFTARVLAYAGDRARKRSDGTREDADGMAIEDFGLADNLMIDAGARRSTGVLIAAEARDADAVLANFERCVRTAADWYAARG